MDECPKLDDHVCGRRTRAHKRYDAPFLAAGWSQYVAWQQRPGSYAGVPELCASALVAKLDILVLRDNQAIRFHPQGHIQQQIVLYMDGRHFEPLQRIHDKKLALVSDVLPSIDNNLLQTVHVAKPATISLAHGGGPRSCSSSSRIPSAWCARSESKMDGTLSAVAPKSSASCKMSAWAPLSSTSLRKASKMSVASEQTDMISGRGYKRKREDAAPCKPQVQRQSHEYVWTCPICTCRLEACTSKQLAHARFRHRRKAHPDQGPFPKTHPNPQAGSVMAGYLQYSTRGTGGLAVCSV